MDRRWSDNWGPLQIDAGPVLLKLATAPDGRYKVRALRGYIRLVRQFLITDAQRAAISRRAWEAAERDAERKLVLQVAERYPSVDMLRLAIEAAKNSGLKKEATASANSIAEKIGEKADIKQLMKQSWRGVVCLLAILNTYSLTAPSVIPDTKNLLSARNTTTTGKLTRIDAEA